MGVIIFDGRSSQDYGIVVEHFPDYTAPSREYDKIHIPGRSGDILVPKDSFQNVKRSYSIAIGNEFSKFQSVSEAISEWLYPTVGYARLEDSYEDKYFRMASFLETPTLTNILNIAGRATISFDCKPYRYLKTGEKIEIINSSNLTLYNPTLYETLPVITVRATGATITGSFSVNGTSVTINVQLPNAASSLIIDCEMSDAYVYNASTGIYSNANAGISVANKFPYLKPGVNTFNIASTIPGNTISSLEVKPKWHII